MRTAIKFLSALIYIAIISAVTAPVLASNSPKYTIAIPPRFDGSAGEFHGGLAAVQNNGKYGLIDKTGNIVAPFEYDAMYIISSPYSLEIQDNYFIAIKNGKWGVIDKTGKLVIPCEYDSVWSGGEGLALVGKGKPVPPGGGTIEGLWGLVDLITGKEILPVKY